MLNCKLNIVNIKPPLYAQSEHINYTCSRYIVVKTLWCAQRAMDKIKALAMNYTNNESI